MLAGHLHRELSLGEPQCFTAVVFAKIDGLSDVCVRLCPILANLKYHPGAKLELALAQQIAYAEQKAGTLLEGCLAPGLKSRERGSHRGFHVLFSGFLVNAHDLRRLCRIERLNLVRRLHPSAANNQVILTPKLPSHFLNSGAHLACVFFLRKIGERLVYERSFMYTSLRTSRGFNGCHECTSERYESYRTIRRQSILAPCGRGRPPHTMGP